MDHEKLIRQLVMEQVAQSGGTFNGRLERSTELFGTGLDSLGFVTLVVALEDHLGIDPFAGAVEISYPETFGELVDLYRSETTGK